MAKYKTTEDFIESAIKIHGDKYQYNLTTYTASKDKLKIMCPKHGIFEQRANNHLRGEGCKLCGIDKNIDNQLLTTKIFIEKAIKIHGDRYHYDKTFYVKGTDKLKITCPKHGIFEQRGMAHIRGEGCPMCKISKGEINILTYLIENHIEFIREYKFKDCINPSTKRELPYDFYLPRFNLLIEYDGELHFKPFKNDDKHIQKLKETQRKDKIKSEYAKLNKINLLRIIYSDFKNINTILTNKLTDEQVFAFVKDCEEADDNINFLLENNSLFE